MSAKTRGVAPLIWAVSAGVALVTAAGAALLVELPPRRAFPKVREGGGLGMQRLENDKVLAEQADLSDPMPLFLSLDFKTRPDRPAGAPELGLGLELAPAFPGKLSYREDAATVEFAPRVPIPARPVDALGMGDPDLPFMGM